jgi:hypothetical protein
MFDNSRERQKSHAATPFVAEGLEGTFVAKFGLSNRYEKIFIVDRYGRSPSSDRTRASR